MNPSTGHLMRLGPDGTLPPGYVVLPTELNHAADAVLGSGNSATVSKHSGGYLSKWAAAQRKAHRKAAKESRRRNRSA